MTKLMLKHLTRGGQVILHNLRMVSQVLGKVLLWLSPVIFLISGYLFYRNTNLLDRALGINALYARLDLFFNGEHHQQTFHINGHSIRIYSKQIIESPEIRLALSRLKNAGQESFQIGILIYGFCVLGVLVWLRQQGDAYTRDKSLKGDYLADVKTLKHLMRQRQVASDLVFGTERLPLPKRSELQHILVHGTTGCGKSTVIKALLDHIRHRKERVIVYDKSCNLMSEFYQSDSDTLLNPLDTRSVHWDLWQECQDKSDFDQLAAALIPLSAQAQDPFWLYAARTLFVAAAHRMQQQGIRDTPALLQYLLSADIQALQQLLKGSEAESLISDKMEKLAVSIKSVLATYLKSLCYLQPNASAFSIRQWVKEDTHSGWLFISSLGEKHESLKPLISTWLDIAINTLLSLSEQPDRRVWVILDELGSLQPLPCLTAALAESRKFGGCFVIGIQSYAQLAKIYGHEGGKEISSLLNTRFLFRTPDPDIAAWSAKNLGESTLEEAREGISYGANTIRDGVSIQKIEREKPVVPAAEILRLADLQCYVRLPGGYPIVKLEMPYVAREKVQEGFVLSQANKKAEAQVRNYPTQRLHNLLEK